MPETVLIVAGESSGELYGSLLSRELKALRPRLRILGVGGERMREAGVEVFAGIASAFGLAEALSSYRAVRETLTKTLRVLEDVSPDLVVLIDYPDFNFRVGVRARSLGIPVLYYVSPQVWAWRRGRVRRMAGFVNRMAVVLPFEEEFYRRSGISCEFVGHPIVDEMAALSDDRASARRELGLPAERSCVALLPGSRSSELKRHLPIFVQVAERLRREFPGYDLLLPVAPNVEPADYDEFETLRGLGVSVLKANAVICLTASDAALVASGTSTLQAALREVPMVVMYRMSPLTFLIARLVVRVRNAAIANLVLGREAVPELLQGEARPDRILAELRPLLADTERRRAMLRDLREVRSHFVGREPSRRVARMATAMAGWRQA